MVAIKLSAVLAACSLFTSTKATYDAAANDNVAVYYVG